MRTILLITALWASGFSIGLGVVPNVVVMMADDMGMGDTSAYQAFTGNADAEQLHTPQMERLARMGMLFTDAPVLAVFINPLRFAYRALPVA